MKILQHLDLLLTFHKNYDKYNIKIIPELGFSEIAEKKLQDNKNIYQSELQKVCMQITNGKADWEYINELHQILIEDRYVIKKEKEEFITLKGRMFEYYGGYIREDKNKKLEKNKTEILNLAVGIGTGLAGLYALYQFLETFLCSFAHCDCTF